MVFSTSNIRSTYEAVRAKHPALSAIIRRFYHGKIFNNVRKKIKGKNNLIESKHSILSSVEIDIKGNNNHIEIGPECIINNLSIVMVGDNNRVKLGGGCKVIKGGKFVLVDGDCELIIGDKTTIRNAHFAITEKGSKVIIGSDCMFAHDIDVRSGDSHSILSSETGERLNYAKDVVIGNHVWVAAHSVILKGVSIPDNSIVATGSVVVNAFDHEEEGIIVAGNPAKKVKSKITWSRER